MGRHGHKTRSKPAAIPANPQPQPISNTSIPVQIFADCSEFGAFFKRPVI
jgi:hypothetical protein